MTEKVFKNLFIIAIISIYGRIIGLLGLVFAERVLF